MGHTEEEVIGIWAISADTEDFYQIIELAVDVSDYCDRRLDVDDVAFLHKKFFCFGAYRLDY